MALAGSTAEIEMPATPRASSASMMLRCSAAEDWLGICITMLYCGSSLLAFSTPRRAMVQKSAAPLTTKARVFFSCATAGLGADTMPAHALIVTAAAAIKLICFIVVS